MTFEELSKQVHAYVENNEIIQSIHLLIENIQDDDKREEVCQVSARFRLLDKHYTSSVITYDEYTRHYSMICKNIFELLRSSEDGFFTRALPPASIPKKMDGKAERPQIPVFFSVGSPHIKLQADFIEELKTQLLKHDIELKPMAQYSASIRDPLKPIQSSMKECCGCLVLAMERLHVKEGIAKRGSETEAPVNNQNYSTPWSHIEAALAYQSGLPFLIIKDEGIKSEGMLDENLFVSKIVRIDTSSPQKLKEYPANFMIQTWVENVWEIFEANQRASNPRKSVPQ